MAAGVSLNEQDVRPLTKSLGEMAVEIS